MKNILNTLVIFFAITQAGLAFAADNADNTAAAGQSGAAETSPDNAKTSSLPGWMPQLLGLQFDGVYQYAPGFHSPYEGPNSFTVKNGEGNQFTETYGVYLGSQITSNLQAYVDLELFKGNGISDGVGLGGFVNGDVIRAGSSNLPEDPYIARMYLRYIFPLSGGEAETVERSMDQLPGSQPSNRWEFKLGKFSATDDFDQNRYADNNRSQFMNYDFLYNTAWDYAADTRGYSYGAFSSLVQSQWKLNFAVFMEPNTANGANWDFFDTNELGYNLELTVKPNSTGTDVRMLTYYNKSKAGNYDAALALGRETDTTPSLLAVEGQDGKKYGFGLNIEQPLADDGETGLFGRIGWNDGNYESWSYVEVDQTASIGLQVSGVHWGRSEDRVGIAYGVNGLSTPHEKYLESGGVGILLGDGGLNYGLEQTIEAYYRIQIGSYVQLSPDFQFIENPGYNKDRGPVEIYGMRLHLNW